MTPSTRCFILDADSVAFRIDELSEVLTDCVNQGASLGFMLPFDLPKARGFWTSVMKSVLRDERLVLAAENACGEIVGTVQLIHQQPENQPHRADVAKLLVHSSARRQGIARQLMATLEEHALKHNKTQLVLDTETGSDAELFYHSCDWLKAGVIPDYAMTPDGVMTGTTVFYKSLAQQ